MRNPKMRKPIIRRREAAVVTVMTSTLEDKMAYNDGSLTS